MTKPPRFRTSPPKSCGTCGWRDKDERAVLVERTIELDREVHQLRTALREYAAHYDDDPSAGSYIALLHARIGVLEQNLDRLIKERGAA